MEKYYLCRQKCNYKHVMKRILILFVIAWHALSLIANEVETIYQGPREIGDWGTVELSSIKFHNLEMGDTIYVYVSQIDSTSKGAFQNHNWNSIPGIINGQTITDDFELVVKSEAVLNELRQFGLKVRGENYVIERIVIKHSYQVANTILIVLGSVILLLILLTIGVLLYKNRQLRKAYASIYQKNLDVIAAADQEHRIRAHYQGQIEAYKEMLQSGLGGKKYQNSTLDEDNKIVITERIFKLFEDSEEYLAADFNMNKLAELVGTNYKNVSQVINENFKKNFNALLNEYRIKEACRRLGDLTHYGNYTVEAIGESVGFGSRSTFICTFKKITGLTPSEYQRQVRR